MLKYSILEFFHGINDYSHVSLAFVLKL